MFSDWKHGRSKSYTKYLPMIADYFGIKVDELIGHTNETKPPTSSEEPAGGQGLSFERALSQLLIEQGYVGGVNGLTQEDREYLSNIIGLLKARFQRQKD